MSREPAKEFDIAFSNRRKSMTTPIFKFFEKSKPMSGQYESREDFCSQFERRESTRRRDFLKLFGLAGLAANVVGNASGAQQRQIRVAAVQMEPKVGDVDANMKKSQLMVRDAIRQGANWVLLPEFFTSGLAIDRSMLDAHRSIDGAPLELLKDLAREGNAVVGGSFLANSGEDVYNTFVLALPNGTTFTHDKDFPSTVFESSFYAAGEDEEFVRILGKQNVKTLDTKIPQREGNDPVGVFRFDNLRVGVAICWEQARYRTAQRLFEKVDIVLAASSWWCAHPDKPWPGASPEKLQAEFATQKTFIREAPRRLARILGVPVIHVNMVGANPGYLDTEYRTKITGYYVGESQIIDGFGNTIANLPDKEGIVSANVSPGAVQPSEAIPDDAFWIPEMNAERRKFWYDSGAIGRDYYLTSARPYRNKSSSSTTTGNNK